MTVDEIFGKISAHMIKGMMVHEQMADYYDFLNLRGYKRCHEYHYFKESAAFRKLSRYYINHFNKLVPEMPVDDPKVIPSSWRQYKRQDVDANTKKNAVKDGIDMWVSWEKSTKEMYEEMYKQLIDQDEIAAADHIGHLIADVDRELKNAERKHLDLKSSDYSMSVIISEQDFIHDKCKKRMKKILG